MVNTKLISGILLLVMLISLSGSVVATESAYQHHHAFAEKVNSLIGDCYNPCSMDYSRCSSSCQSSSMDPGDPDNPIFLLRFPSLN